MRMRIPVQSFVESIAVFRPIKAVNAATSRGLAHCGTFSSSVDGRFQRMIHLPYG